MNSPATNDKLPSIEDAKFDQIFPPHIRALSSLHWTPVAVAAEAARLLVTAPDTRVLDIGCGPGKFCLVAASLTDGKFTGVEQRSDLVAAARRAATELTLSGVEFIHGNVTDVAFADYDAFYLYNPFAENTPAGHKIDRVVALSTVLLNQYTKHVADQLGRRPLGTRVVSYAGYTDEIPGCYVCESAHFRDELKLWIKKREYDPDLERLGLAGQRSYRGADGWAPPRELPSTPGPTALRRPPALLSAYFKTAW